MEYDNYGNIISKNGKQYCYDETWHDLLTCYDGQAIEYDAQGNPVSYFGNILTWEKGRQLKSFGSNTYTYNANGIRTSKTVNGIKHEYTLDGTKILRETWGDNTIIPLYDNEDSVCGILYNRVPYYFIKNLQGDVIAIVDKDAETVAKYSYDAWGVCTVTQDSVGIATINPFRYRGYFFDEEIGLYYLQSRYYDPQVGRFINSDNDAQALGVVESSLIYNLFAYCINSPVNSTDYTGNLGAQLTAKIILGIMIGFLVQLISDLIGYWFSLIFNNNGDYAISSGDYLASMLSWALTCVSFNSKLGEICAAVIPVIIKQIWRMFNKNFDWIDLAIDIVMAAISIIINKCLSKKTTKNLSKIKAKAGNGNKSNSIIRVKTKRLNIKMQALGIRFNFGLNISSFFVSILYNYLMAKNK